ncbi:DUF4062 domain-containing protein [Leptospira bouyouniensis]|uniref:DUF4062 domain-containing protein n=1 Tax=Leptospira bouyouniensis TaxID=2484911 RepID=UPI001090E35A|nr:DUF4062 domain-containing protein [Leptospira bouyouniensis]TGM74342.1 DUF4062 domain-containing protein [Leptospira bouyouniensis]
MAIPKVFISSTYYDLKYIRENLKYFVSNLGYEPILNEEGSIFYNPEMHTHDSCLYEVPNSQLFVLIIGGRSGGNFKDTDQSITNQEYKTAVEHNIPVFALIEESVYSEHHVYKKNQHNDLIDQSKIVYPSTDSTKIFDFIDEVRLNSINNAIFPFKNFGDIQKYLQQQWAGMMFSFLTSKNQNEKVNDMVQHILKLNERIEFLSSQIIKSVGTSESKIIIRLHNKMLENPGFKSLLSTGFKPTLLDVLTSEDLVSCSKKSNPKGLQIIANLHFLSSGSGEIDMEYYEKMNKSFLELKEIIENEIIRSDVTKEKIIESLENPI